MAGGMFKALDEKAYVRIGKGFHSDDVAKEKAEVLDRWQSDMEVLKSWGFGVATLTAFEALSKEHDKKRQARPEAVSAKSISIEARRSLITEAWESVHKVAGALCLPATKDPAIAADLSSAMPTDDAGLSSGVVAMAKLLTKHSGVLDPEFDAASIVNGAEGLASRLDAQVGTVGSAKQATKEDTREIDLLDGQIVVVIRNLNKTARKAFRTLGNRVKVQEYQYNHLARGAAKRKAEPTPAP